MSQLKCFQIVAELENMTRAADVLRVAQPSLSKTIAHLEQDLGVPLFERQGRRLRLNQFGKAFLNRVQRILNELDQARSELGDMAGLSSGHVTVGVTTSQILPNIFEDYLAKYPDIKFKLFQVSGRYEIPNQLRDGAFDLCISSLPIEPPTGKMEMASRELLTEEIFLAVCKEHPLAGRDSVHLREVSAEKFVSYSREDGFRGIIDRFCHESGFSPNVVFESSNTSVICNLVGAGAGIALLPAFWWKVGTTDNLVQLRVSRPMLRRTIWLSWMKDRYLPPAAQHFRKFITDYFRAQA